MRVTLLSGGRHAEVLKRLQGMGHRVQVDDPDRILSLDEASLDLVYLVPHAEVLSNRWGETRVRLARASRYYVVFGAGLGTRELMAAARDGAHDVVVSGDSDARWNEALESGATSQALWWQLYGAHGRVAHERLVGRSPTMRALRESVQRIGPTEVSVLITGESGTGKERVAEAVHAASGKGSFVAMNCAAIPSELLESELFGVEKGAYTGAHREKPGLVEEASGGTLFLDEIGELDLTLQPKLLRFLETRRARRVGATREYACQVRVVSATNRDLRQESEQNRFRLDLYYRVSEIVLNTPPLRHHLEDIPELAKVFLEDAAVRLGKNFESLEPELIYKFQQYDWPGNVRELKQMIERLAIHYDGPMMRAAWWEPPAASALPVPKRADNPQPAQTGSHAGAELAMPWGGMPNKRERYLMASRLLQESGGDLTWTAARLGVHPSTLYRWRQSGKV